MGIFSPKGGLKLQKNKTATKNTDVLPVLPLEGEKLTFLMKQSSGEPAVPIVEKDQNVKIGQKIAEGRVDMSAHIHSSVSGKVLAVSDFEVVVENDGIDETLEFSPTEDYLGYSASRYLELIREAGIVGLGGGGFPTHVKLSAKAEQIKHVIINGAECEPYLTTDYKAMTEKSESIMRGIHILQKIFANAQVFIAIEKDKPDAINLYRNILSTGKSSAKIEVKALPATYPGGGELLIIKACTGLEVPQDKLPFEIGCIVINISTTAAIDDAVTGGRPLMRRIVTLAGGAVNQPGNYDVPIGMSLKSIVEAAGGFKEEAAKLIGGGPMMGKSVFDLADPVIKTTGGLLAFTKQEAELPEEEPCIRCTRCAVKCPVGLQPFELNALALAGNLKGFEALNGMECIECGSCSYICPSKRYLAQSIILAKKNIMQKEDTANV